MQKVLLYCDDEVRCQIITEWLAEADYEVRTEVDLSAAQFLIGGYEPEVVVIDAFLMRSLAMLNYCARTPCVHTGPEALADMVAIRDGRTIIYTGLGDMSQLIPEAVARALS